MKYQNTPGGISSFLPAVPLILALCCSSCSVPLPDKVTSGHRHSGEALRFLDFPNTTREEVIASLGPPLVEVPGAGVLLYSWETTPRYLFIYPKHFHHGEIESGSKTQCGDPQLQGLFIRYNQEGKVTAHQVRDIGSDGLEEACVEWATAKEKR